MKTVRTVSWLLIATLWCVQDARAYHKPGWDTGHQTMNSNPGIPELDPGETRPNGCGSPVEVASGNFIHALPQLSLSGVGPDVDLTLIYNSHDLRRGAFGVGWTHAWEERLIVTTDGAQIFAICCQGRGKRDRMLRLADGRRYATATLHLTMVRNPNETHTLRDKHGNVKEFDTDGKMTRLVDRNGNAVALGYDAAGFLTTITDAAGRVTRFTKGTNGRVASVTDPANRVFQYAYDASGHLSKVTDPLGHAWTFDYDDKGLLSEIVDPRGNVQTAIAYDELRRVQTLTEKDERWTYSYATRQTTKRDAYGDTWVYQYNEAGSITKATNPLGKAVSYTYDAALNMTSMTDESGRVTRYTYDGSGNVVSMIDALGNVYSIGYDGALSLPVGLTDPLGNATQLQYDSRGNLTAVTDPGGAVSRFTYDAKGQMTQSTDASGAISKFAYDARGYVVSFIAPGKAAATATYDILGNLLTFTDARGMKYEFSYDANRRLLTSTNPAGAPTSRQYDPAGNLTTLTLPTAAQFRFEYDAYDRLLRLTNPVNETTIYNYDHRGNITWSRDGQGRTILYQYDALDRLLTKSTPNETTRYTYDAVGNLLSLTNGSSGLTYTYDALNRVLKAGSTPQNVTITYTYDAAGRLGSLDDGDSRQITYSYNRRSLVANIADFDGFNATFSYDPNRRRIRMERTGGFATAYTYDGAGRLLSMKQTSPAGPLDFAYTYDQSDNRVSMTDASGKHLYGYNRRDQLISAGHPTADNPPETYSYDPVGNRIASHLSATHAYDAANRLTADATFDYTYDADGNPTQRRNRANGNIREYTYDAENRLTKITFPDGTSATYSYDALGRRYEKNVSGQITRYVYAGETILRELDSAGKTIARYTPGLLWDEMLAVRRGGITSVVETDGLGSVIRTVAGSTPNATFRYDSFGRVVARTGTPQSPFAFQGRELDAESQLYYFRARYYDPAMGRFVTEDPIGLWGGSNLYAFVGNNPVNILDPEGLAPRTPARGAPNSVKEFPNPAGKTVRHYGPDGRASKDIDYGHDHGAGDPHVHDWDWSKPGDERGKKARKPEPGEVPEDSSARSCSIDSGPNSDWRDRAATAAIILGAGLITATIVEDLLTGGAGAWNDPATVGTGMTLIRSGWGRIPGAMRPAGAYP